MARLPIGLLVCFACCAGCTVGTAESDAGTSMDAPRDDAPPPPETDACAPDCGAPADACAIAAATHSNVGCEYWAVDLDNEDTDFAGVANDAAGAQYAVVIANPSDSPATVRVEVNDA